MKKRTSMIVAGCAAAALALGGIGVYAAGQLTKAAAITEEDAYRFALADAGVNAENAALLAVQILSVKYPELRTAFKAYKDKMEADILAIDAEMNA